MSRRLWIVCLALVACVLGIVSWQLISPSLTLDGADNALRSHNFEAARQTLFPFLRAHPEDKRALLLAAQMARRTGSYAEAERFLESLHNSEAGRKEWILLGVQQGDFGEHELMLLTAVKQNAADASLILEALAKGYDVSYRWPEAIAVLDVLIQRSPDHHPALVLRGTIQQRLRQAESAEKDFRQAVKLAPKNAAAQAALAGLLCKLGHTHEAIEHYETALRLQPHDDAALVGLARAWLDAAELDKAGERLAEALRLGDGDFVPQAALEAVRLQLRQGKTDHAGELILRLFRFPLWHREGQRLKLAVLEALKREEDASRSRELLQKLEAEDAVAGRLKLRARENPMDAEVRWQLWLWCARNGEPAEGLAFLTEVLRADPRHRLAHDALARHFEHAGQPRRGAEHRTVAAAPKGSK